MRFFVRASAQSALFRRMRFSSPGQTRRRLTEKRILAVGPHGKVHSERAVLTEKRTLGGLGIAGCAFP